MLMGGGGVIWKMVNMLDIFGSPLHIRPLMYKAPPKQQHDFHLILGNTILISAQTKPHTLVKELEVRASGLATEFQTPSLKPSQTLKHS